MLHVGRHGWTPVQPASAHGPVEEPQAPTERAEPKQAAGPAALSTWPRQPDRPLDRPGDAVDTAEGAALPATVMSLLRSGRIDPGRRGALALAAVGVVAAIVTAVVLMRGRPSEQPLPAPVPLGPSASAAGADLVVDVAGRVRHPGLVRLRTGARVDDALKAAGGVLPGVSTGVLNLARKVADGEQVLVGVDGPAAASGAAGAGVLLDLNTATAQDFDALPGIGPVLAERLVSWRTEHGRFASVDQLREVSGVGESKYQSIKPKVRV